MTRFQSWDDYFHPGTQILKSRRGIRDHQELRNFEEVVSLAEVSDMLTHKPVPGNFDRSHMKAIHQRIFGRVYEWAGQERVAPATGQMVKVGPSPRSIAQGDYTANDEYPYYYYPANDDMAPHFDRQVRRLHSYGDMSDESSRGFAEKIAEPWGEINVAHIFREGNTRAQIAFFTKFARHHGHDFDFERFSNDLLFRAKFNAGRFLIQANIDSDLFMETVTQSLDGASAAAVNPAQVQPHLPVDYQPNRADIPYDPKYVRGTNTSRHGFQTGACGAMTVRGTACKNGVNCFHHRGGRSI